MEDLKIRLMEAGDAAEVSAIEAANFSIPWKEKDFLDSIVLPHTVYVAALLGDKVVGYCGCYQSLEEAEIVNVAVDESVRGRHIGHKMIEKMIEEGRKLGICSYMLEVRASNAPAIALYESLGFKNLGVRKNFYDLPKEDAIIMWLDDPNYQ